MNFECAKSQKQFDDVCTIKGAPSIKNQSLTKIIIEQIKNIAKRWSVLSLKRAESKGSGTYRIASAYYLNQIP
ncbi:MAG: hypothetical protein ACE1ZS_06270 [Candidatus Poribacteria bacterium]